MTLFLGFFAMAQNGLISGRVLDENGLGLPGATLILTDLENKAAISDVNGAFTILGVPAGSHTLKVSFIGYSKMERDVHDWRG